VTTPEPVSALFASQGCLFASQQLINQGKLFRSEDPGRTWTDITGPVTSSYLCSHAFWQGRVLLSVYRGGGLGALYSSQDLGDSWQAVPGLPTNRNINGMAIAGDGSLAIGASGSDGGASSWLSPDLSTWTDFTGNLPEFAQPFNELASEDGWFFKTGGTVPAYRTESPGAAAVAGAAAAAALPLEARPNPVRARAVIGFSLDSGAPVEFGGCSSRRWARVEGGAAPGGPGLSFRERSR
jgi:hypothetical protein